MEGFAIVKIGPNNSTAQKDHIVSQFNDYFQSKVHSSVASFIDGEEGYFRLEYESAGGISSAGVVEFSGFLQSSGYKIGGIRSAETLDGRVGTEILFSKCTQENGGACEASVILLPENIY